MSARGEQPPLDGCCKKALRCLFDELNRQRVVDIRKPPDDNRQGQFKRGWAEYRAGRSRGSKSLGQLTWNNLGWRAGDATRHCTAVDPESVYQHLADNYASRAWRLKEVRWEARTREDNLLKQYWQDHGGQIHVEAPVGVDHGPWAGEGSVRRLDGLRIDTPEKAILLPDESRIQEALGDHRGAAVEVIEVKQRLDRTVIGQTRAGRLLLCARYGLDLEQVREVVVYAEGDAALEWVCEQLGIKVWIPQIDPA